MLLYNRQIGNLHRISYTLLQSESFLYPNMSLPWILLMLMANWTANVVDVKGALLLHGEFTDGEEIFMEVPQGFERTTQAMWY